MAPAIVLGIVLVAIALFATERIPLEVAALVLITLLALSGILTPEEAFAGIANETVIFIFTLLSMTQGLASTGVMQIVGRRASMVRNLGERAFLTGLLAMVAAFSSIASNTAVAAAFLPMASATAARARIPRSRVLLPMAYASMLGGMIFLYGTSTNLVVSEAMRRFGHAPIGFAELAPVGLPAAIGVIALLVVGRNFLLPARTGPEHRAPLGHRIFVTEAVVTARSRYAGSRIADVAAALGFEVVGIRRGTRWLSPRSRERLRPDDRLVIRGSRRAILRLRELRSMVLRAELELPAEQAGRFDERMAEVFVPPHSPLIGQSLRSLHFTRRLGLVPLAIHRHPGAPPIESGPLGSTILAAGDVLLVSGSTERLRELENGRLLQVLGAVPWRPPRYRKATLALLIFGASIAVAAAGVVPQPIAGLVGMLTMIGTGCMSAGDAFRVEWRVVLLIGALLALGDAMQKSGAGEILARALVPLAAPIGPHGLLFLVMALTVGLSAPMSNQAAALVVLPIALHAAGILGVDPRPFAIGTALAASCSFMTPLEPAAALVYGAGHYRFADFLRAGTPLTAALLAFFTFAIPWRWPF